jgi:hypothetical protein
MRRITSNGCTRLANPSDFRDGSMRGVETSEDTRGTIGGLGETSLTWVAETRGASGMRDFLARPGFYGKMPASERGISH